jgi:hypothetical protein
MFDVGAEVPEPAKTCVYGVEKAFGSPVRSGGVCPGG